MYRHCRARSFVEWDRLGKLRYEEKALDRYELQFPFLDSSSFKHPDGHRNAIVIHRLKDKLGDRSNASSEAELRGAWARLLGEEGRGIAVILRMVQYTRMNTALGSVGIAHQSVTQALHYTSQRQAFGKAM